MRLLMTQYLENRVDLTTLAEIAEIALDQQEFEKAIKKAEEGLSLLNNLHAEAIKFYCILMRAKYGIDNLSEADSNFS